MGYGGLAAGTGQRHDAPGDLWQNPVEPYELLENRHIWIPRQSVTQENVGRFVIFCCSSRILFETNKISDRYIDDLPIFTKNVDGAQEKSYHKKRVIGNFAGGWYLCLRQEGTMKKITIQQILLLIAITLLLGSCSTPTEASLPEEDPEPLLMQYYYYPGCEGCNDGEQFADYLDSLVADFLGPEDYKIELKNVAQETACNEFQEIIDTYQTDDFYPSPPLLIVDDTYLFGLEEIETQVRKAAMDAHNTRLSPEQLLAEMEMIPEDTSFFVYFYKDNCPYCVETDDYFRRVNKTQTLADGTVTDIHFACIDISDMENMPIASKFYEYYEVPEKLWKAPMVFWKGGYLFGSQAIQEQFLDLVLDGQAMGWPGVDAVPVA